MKYDELTTRYAKWLFPLIDRRNCGFLHADDRPRHFHTAKFLASRDWDYPPRPITRTDLAGHLFGADTLYYHSWHESGYVLAMIDIDAKTRQTDAQSVADWLIATYLPNAYCEPSTRGKGRHVYALFRVGNESPWNVNPALARAGCALKALAAHRGFDANIDNMFGTFTLWSKDDEGHAVIKDRGLLGKMPRLPRGLSSLTQLTSAPVFLPSALSLIIADADKLRTPPLSSSSCTKVSTSESPKDNARLASVSIPPSTKASTSESSENPKLTALRERTASIGNPMARMRWASSLFYHQHGRYAANESETMYAPAAAQAARWRG